MMHALSGPPNPADADDARPLGGSATHSKNAKHRLALQGRLRPRVLMMLAGCPPEVRKTRASKQGSAALAIAPFANAKLASHGEPAILGAAPTGGQQVAARTNQ